MSVGVGAPLAAIHGSALCAVLHAVLGLVAFCDCVLNAFRYILKLSCFTCGYKTPKIGNVLHHYCSHYNYSRTDLFNDLYYKSLYFYVFLSASYSIHVEHNFH